MDYLQYVFLTILQGILVAGFKPYYKWITFNTNIDKKLQIRSLDSFKPYYKWITFNTYDLFLQLNGRIDGVLNLIINGLPSILQADSEAL